MTTRSDLDALKAEGYQVSPDVARLNKGNPALEVINNPSKLRKLREAVGIKEREDDFGSWLMDCAHLNGWLASHTRPAMVVKNGEITYRTPIQGDKGAQDWILARGGVVLPIELKSENGKLTPEEKAWQKAANGFVFRPSDREKIEELLH